MFTAHSIPLDQPGRGAYVAELTDLSRVIHGAVGGGRQWALAFQSRSGRPGQPGLVPDVGDHLKELRDAGTDAVVVVPIGFVSDHMEVVHDLDVEAAGTAAKLGLTMERAATVGTHPRFVAMVRELLLERADPGTARPAVGSLGAADDRCAAACCRTAS